MNLLIKPFSASRVRASLPLFLVVIILGNYLNAQVLFPENNYPGVSSVKEKSFNGSARGNYWSLSNVDAGGNVKKKARYRNRELLAAYEYAHNQRGDLIAEIIRFDINRPDQTVDTGQTITYAYDAAGIILRSVQTTVASAIITTLMARDDEHNHYTYDREIRSTVKASASIPTYRDEYLVAYGEDGSRTVLRHTATEPAAEAVTTFFYYPNGLLRRRLVERTPPPAEPAVYVGGIGSDDDSYSYNFYPDGRVKTKFLNVAGKRLKLNRYWYK
jgi:hypothetical protein